MTDEIKQEEKEEQAIDWDALIKACNKRPKGMTVVEFCEQNGVTKANFYYHQRQHKKAEKNNKKRKSKKAVKETPVIEEPIINEDVTTLEYENADVVVQEPKETEVAQEAVEVEETPAIESVNVNDKEMESEEETIIESINETEEEEAKEAAQEPVITNVIGTVNENIAVQEPTSTIDITIGSSTIHVTDNTSPELLSMVVQTIFSNMKKSDEKPN